MERSPRWLTFLLVSLAACPGTRQGRLDAARSREAAAVDGAPDVGVADRGRVDSARRDGAKPDQPPRDHRAPDHRPPDLVPPSPDLPLGPTLGKLCTATSPCAAGESCAFVNLPGSSTTTGFCTKHCPALATACTGGPAGSIYYCALTGKSATGQTTYACAFFCQLSGKNAPCPPALACSPTEQPPGSGQRICMVP